MKGITQDFKDNIKKYGRQLDANIIVGNEILDTESINSINPSFNTGLFKTVMHVLEIDSNVKIEKDTYINAKVGVKFDSSDYEYIEYNNYKVTEKPEIQEDTLSYKIMAYDKMVESMIDYDLNITERITVRQYLIVICQRLGWNTNNIPASFTNSNKLIDPSLHIGIRYTFRDVLDEIATISCSFLFFEGEDFYLAYVTETDEIVDEEYLNEDDVTIGEEYFINSLVFARAEESDNIYRKDDESIERDGLHEFRISDNQLLSTNNRSDYIDEMFEYLSSFRFYTYDVKSKGIMFLDICDRFTFNIHGQAYSTIMLNNEIRITQGLEECLYADKPEESETDYKYADLTDKRINQTYILVDKQNQKITQLANQNTEFEEKLTIIEQDVDGIKQNVRDIVDYKREAESRTEIHLTESDDTEILKLEIQGNTTYENYLYPNENLYPSENLYPNMEGSELL